MTVTAHTWEIVALLAALAAILYVRRHGGSDALEALERSNRILTGRVHELERENHRQAGEIASLRAKTDVASAVAPVLDALRHHEERATERTDRTLAVLSLIADRLGPESNS